jgi:hypothetical protein
MMFRGEMVRVTRQTADVMLVIRPCTFMLAQSVLGSAAHAGNKQSERKSFS